MLADLFSRASEKYLSLPLFGPVMNDFSDWLEQQGYTFYSRRYYVWIVACMDEQLRRRKVKRLQDLSPLALHDCLKAKQRRSSMAAHARFAHLLEKFLTARGIFKISPCRPSSPTEIQLQSYSEYLREVRGLSSSTVQSHMRTTSRFLAHLGFDTAGRRRVLRLKAGDLESFLQKVSKRQSRATLQHTVAELRSFLRFLVTTGKVTSGLESQIDTPRLYRQEQLPRALPWETVQAFLQSIPRETSRGRRDHAMFFLMATYGLRSCEVAALTLDDIQWRVGLIRVPQSKTGARLELPLTDEVASVLIEYLRKVPRPANYRQIFLRLTAPIGALKPHAVSEAFHVWAMRSGLDIPFYGAHCIRHSYAVHLLRQGTSLKAIGDLLGHRCAESTTDYLRLSTEDLREVGLSVPQLRSKKGGRS